MQQLHNNNALLIILIIIIISIVRANNVYWVKQMGNGKSEKREVQGKMRIAIKIDCAYLALFNSIYYLPLKCQNY